MNNINFTRREQVTKTASLALEPQGKTRETIRKNKYIEKDTELVALKKDAFLAIDSFIKCVIDKTLSDYEINWDTLYEIKTSKDTEKINYKKNVEELEETLVKQFYAKIKEIAKSNLDSPDIRKFLLTYIDSAEDLTSEEKTKAKYAIDKMGSNFGFFNKLITNRKGALTNAATRVFENFDIYVENMEKLKTFLDSSDSDRFIEDYPDMTTYYMPSYYSQCLRQSDINAYNTVISGDYDKEGNLISYGYNQFANELNISRKGDTSYTGPVYKKVDKLKKQILFPRDKKFAVSFIESDDEVRAVLKIVKEEATEENLAKIRSLISNEDSEGITIPYNLIHKFSDLVYKDHNTIMKNLINKELRLLENQQMEATTKSARGKIEKQINSLEKELKKRVFTIKELGEYCNDDTLLKIYTRELLRLRDNVVFLAEELDRYDIFNNVRLRDNHERIEAINKYFSAITEFTDAINIIRKKESDDKSDQTFYYELDAMCDMFKNLDTAHNMVRNYLTKKIGERAAKETIQMSFGNPYFTKGTSWTKHDGDDKPIREISILKKDGKYYFGCHVRGERYKFKYIENTKEVGNNYEVMYLSKGQKAGMFLPLMTFSKAVKYFEENPNSEEYIISTNMETPICIDKNLVDNYKKRLHTGQYDKEKYTEEAHKEVLVEVINVYKQFIDAYSGYKKYSIYTKPAQEYESLAEFLSDVDRTKFIMDWAIVDAENLDKAVEEGKYLLFLITNREMYREDKEIKRTYAKQFLAIMSEENFAHPIIQINSVPQIFWRDAIIPRKVTHPRGSILLSLYDKNNERVPDKIREILYRYYNGKIDGKSLTSEAKAWKDKVTTYKAEWDIVKNERFTKEAFIFSFSYTINRDISSNVRNTISMEVTEKLENEHNILTVTRGYDNLIYCRVTDKYGNELEEKYLNSFDKVNYRDELLKKTFERRDEKKEWFNEIAIKGLRTGYIDKAISEILQLVDKYNAIILIEKINDKYKDKASSFDNQVYKTFEERLRSRLITRVDVKKKNSEEGGALYPMQYINPKINKEAFQNGILFQINNAYTSTMCPITGFVNIFNTDSLNSIAQKRNFLSKFDAIYYDKKKEGFIFVFDYNNFPTKILISKTKWKIDATRPATKWDREAKKNIYYNNASEDLIDLLESNHIEYENADIVKLIEEGISGKVVNGFFDLFFGTIKNTMVRKCDKVEESYYSSPVVDTVLFGLSKEKVVAINMINKFIYHINGGSNNKEYNEGFVNYVIDNII